MKQINLVPPQLLQKAASKRSAPYIVLGVLVGVGMAGALWAGFSIQVKGLHAQRDALLEERARAQAQAAKTAAENAPDSDLVARVTQLNTLAKTDINWRNVFAYVASITPKDIVLSNYSIGAGAGGATLKITGTAPSNVSYATFAAYLKESIGKQITDFKVDGYTFIPQAGTVTFAITITVPSTAITYTAS